MTDTNSNHMTDPISDTMTDPMSCPNFDARAVSRSCDVLYLNLKNMIENSASDSWKLVIK